MHFKASGEQRKDQADIVVLRCAGQLREGARGSQGRSAAQPGRFTWQEDYETEPIVLLWEAHIKASLARYEMSKPARPGT